MGNDSEHRHGPKLNRTAVGRGPAMTLRRRCHGLEDGYVSADSDGRVGVRP
jgi:hypothetical protein